MKTVASYIAITTGHATLKFLFEDVLNVMVHDNEKEQFVVTPCITH
jgi:hypothetical protein